jgi:hypothetical protein
MEFRILLLVGMDNPNTIMVIDKMDDVNKAKDFSMLPSLKDAMKKAGVLNPKFGFCDGSK